MTERGSRTEAPNKVARLVDEYDLGEAFVVRLEDLWTGHGDERRSLRDLADIFNRRLLAEAMAEEGVTVVEGEVENLYRLLTADDVSSGMRAEARTRLERNGVDVDRVERDFVSYQAVRTFLRDARGVEYRATGDAERVRNVDQTINRLRSRARSVGEGSLEQLRDTGRLTLGEFRLFVDVDVLCEECGSQYDVSDLLDRGGCDCPRDGAESE